MLGRIFTVGSYTLLSRLTGFARDIMLAAILGAGPVADAFFVAFRLPNHFRAIFAEGAFNAAFVPAYAHVHGEKGEVSAKLFADRIFTLLFLSQVILLVVAWLFMPQAMSVLAPGFSEDAEQRRLAIELTRITFPYLLLITLVTLYGGMLNVMHRFASAAAASIFLNIAMMATLAVAVWFPTPGHAAAWGVLVSGFLQYFLLAGDLATHGGLPRFAPLKLDEDIRAFFGALGPATIGSMGTQVAMFADTIIATFLPAGALSALYYADRLNQLPIGVIGIAVGTVLLPEMARRISAGDNAGAMAAQRRAFDFTLLLSVPFVAAFLAVPEVDHAGAVRARRLLQGRCRGSRRDTCGLCGRAHSLRADPQCRRDLLRAQGYRDAGQGLAHGAHDQHGTETPVDGCVRANRPGARHRRRRLGQFAAGARLCGACRLPRIQPAVRAVAAAICREWRGACCGALVRRPFCCITFRGDQISRRSHAAVADRCRRRGLCGPGAAAVRPALASGL